MDREIKVIQTSTITKIIYKKPKVLLEEIPDRKNLLENIESAIDIIVKKNINTDTEKISNNCQIFKDSKTSIDYPQIYNQLFILSNKNVSEFLNVNQEISNMIKIKIEKLLADVKISEDRDEFERELQKLMEIYKISENITETIKSLTTNNNTRFQSSLVLNITPINTKTIFIDYINKNHLNFSERLKTYFDSSDNIYKDNFILTVINFLRAIGCRTIYNQILEVEREKIINFHRVDFVAQMQNFFEDNLAEFLINYNTKIDNIIFNFKILFGEHNASALNEKLMEDVFMNNLSQIFNFKSVMDSLWNKKNLQVLNLLYNIMNKKIDSLISFQNQFFNKYVEKFFAEIKIPQNLKEGLVYVEFLLDKITTLNEIFVKYFNRDRRIHLRYKETISRLTNNKNVKNMAMLCGVFINEIMSRNIGNLQNINEVLNNFSPVLQSIEDRENFFMCVHKLMIKRISNMKYVKENEMVLIKILWENFGNRLCFPLFRVTQDLEKSEIHFNLVKEYIKTRDDNFFNLIQKGTFNLFSFNSINQNDLTEIIQNRVENNLMKLNDIVIEKYVQQYPHRTVSLSQNLSTCILSMTSNKVELLLNYIQASILLKLNSKGKSMRLEELISSDNLNVKATSMANFRSNVISLINIGLLLMKNNKKINYDLKENQIELLNTDELCINLTFIPNKYFLNLTNIAEISNLSNKKDELLLTRDHTSQSDINALQNSIESQSSIYLANKSFIIDCKIMKLLKNYKEIEHNQLTKFLLAEMKLYYSASNMPEISFFQTRLENLIERSIISRKIEDNKIIYRYS